MKKIVLSLIAVTVFASVGFMVYNEFKSKEISEKKQPRKSNIEYPIILVHGMGGKAKQWKENYKVVDFFINTLNLGYGGSYYFINDSLVTDSLKNEYDFFTLQFSDGYSSATAKSHELSKIINNVIARTYTDKVILIGFSMGGIVARKYLTENIEDHKVKKLVTIGSPHHGSTFARVYDFRRFLNVNRNKYEVPFLLNADSLIEFTNSLSRWLLKDEDFNIGKDAVRDLRPPRKDFSNFFDIDYGETFLYRLNRARHPKDVEYFCVIGEISAYDSYQRIVKVISEIITLFRDDENISFSEIFSKLGEIRTVFLSLAGNVAVNIKLGGLLSMSVIDDGDGIVSSYSQNLKNVEAFINDSILVQELVINDAAHLEQCLYHDRIRIAIGENYLRFEKKLYSESAKINNSRAQNSN